MSKGYSGMFNGTKGSRVAFGSTDYMSPLMISADILKGEKMLTQTASMIL